MNKFIDFDAFMAETKEEPIVIRIFGKDEELPASLPADVILNIIRKNQDGQQIMSDAETFEMAERIFGGKLAEWCENGLTVSQLEALIMQVMTIYTGNRKGKTQKHGQGKKGGNKKTPRHQ